VSTLLKDFSDLSNFQQWTLFYLIKKEKMRTDVREEINNFCDKTKYDIDLDNYDKDMTNLQGQLNYFVEEGLIDSADGFVYTLTKKGDLYCFQQLNRNLKKLMIESVKSKITLHNFYKPSKILCDKIFSNYYDLKVISDILIGDPKDTMTRLQIFAEIIRALSNITV